jgi:hypothetical protein
MSAKHAVRIVNMSEGNTSFVLRDLGVLTAMLMKIQGFRDTTP